MNPNFDPLPYQQHFAKNCQQIKGGPVPNQNRSLQDVCCLFVFIAIVLATLIIGAIMISDGNQFYQQIYNGSGTKADITGLAQVFSRQGGIIVGMFFFALALSVVFLLLLKNFARCMVYTMAILIYLVFIALIIIGIINGIWWMVIVFAVTILITTCLLCCFRSQIQTGIMLLQIASTFMTQKPSVYIAPVYPLIFSIIFFVFWVVAMLGQIYALSIKYDQAKTNSNISTSKQNAFIIVFIVIFIFMINFFNYVQVYLVATCCGFWYYGIDDNYYTKGAYRMNRFNLGSITFGALLITIITILRQLVESSRNRQQSQGNIIACICLTIVGCCLTCIQNIVQTLNHNAIIVMTVTGQSYWDSAKTALGIIYEHFALFGIVRMISNLVTFFGLLITVGIPTLTGFLIIKYGRQAQSYVASYGAVAIFFMSIIIASLVLSLLTQALSCIFIFYCMNSKFRRAGYHVANCPPCITSFQQYGHLQGPANTYNNAPRTDQELKTKPYF